MINEVIRPAIDGGWLLQLHLGNKTFLVRPHSLMADPFNSHLYLVGYARYSDKPDASIASFRITRITAAKLRRQNGRLSPEEKNLVEKQLQQLGVQYLVGTQDHIEVRLSKLGRQVFLQRSYMRPTPVQVEGDVYHFHCSAMQVRNYFLSFGKEAEILRPLSLRKEFAKAFKDASKVYG